ncbi:hypothetical protein [Streptomyces sp. NPDC048669]|uniref:hypothetical protein n=1 Tax=Streptomyces sp. NPDC048669 TaxID=3155267 RepID=UPI0034162427
MSDSAGYLDPQFNVVFEEEIGPDVDTEILRGCLERVLQSNDAFSLRFCEVPFWCY